MSLWIKSAIVVSVILLLLFGYSLNKIYSTKYVPEASYLVPLTIPMPLVRKETALNTLIAGLPQDRQYFRQMFLEIMSLQGVQKNKFGQWLAIFADAKGKLVRLAPGQVYDGVTVKSADAGGCETRYGSIERRFVLP